VDRLCVALTAPITHPHQSINQSINQLNKCHKKKPIESIEVIAREEVDQYLIATKHVVDDGSTKASFKGNRWKGGETDEPSALVINSQQIHD
jgi:hypothetical protein